MNILLINPLHVGKEDVPPIELMRASAVLPTDTNTRLIDFNKNNKGIDDLLDEVDDFSPELVVILGRNIKTYKRVKETSAAIRRVSGSPIICCGDIRVAYQTILSKTGIDAVVNGDIEPILLKIVSNISGNVPLFNVPGLITKISSSRSLVRDLDSLPFPDYEIIDKNYFGSIGLDKKCDIYKNDKRSRRGNFQGKKSMEIYTSLGCNKSCSFCVNKGTKNRRYSVDYVMEHLRFLATEYNVGMVDIGDPCFTEDKLWVDEFAERLLQDESPILFRIYGARTDQVDRELLEKLYKAGCVSIYFGIESLSQSHLDIIRKGTTVEQNIEALTAAIDIGLHAPVQLIWGLPEENDQMLQDTLETLEEQGISIAKEKVRYILPIPGTPVYNTFRNFGMINDEESYLLSVSDIDTTNPWRCLK